MALSIMPGTSLSDVKKNGIWKMMIKSLINMLVVMASSTQLPRDCVGMRFFVENSNSLLLKRLIT